jgi:Flp pilus assembly protein TadG
VEFIFALPVCMMLFFGIYEFSRYYTTRLRIRTAVAEATRFATTGNTLADADTGDPLSRSVSIRQTILNQVDQFGVTSDNISIDPEDGGGPEEIVTVTVDYEYQVAVPLMAKVFEADALDFSVSTSMRNEPFFE